MEKIYRIEEKNKAIVIFKFFAALLITYSHMRLLFPKYGELVTGGAIGDGLFFFCSGFTLFMGRDGGFMNWYKRRVSRIYPSIIMWALFSSVVFGWTWKVTDLIMTPKYWFIPCIMVYYAIFYLIRCYLMSYMKQVFVGAFLLVMALSFFVLDRTDSVMYAQVSFMRIYFFMFMLMGAIVALDLSSNKGKRIFEPLVKVVSIGNKIDITRSFFLFLGNIVAYYVCMGVYKIDAFYCNFQIVSLIPLLLAIYYFFMFCSCVKVQKVFERPLLGNIVYVISAMTLEVYLVQYALFTDRWNGVFPLNIPLMYLLIFIVAYGLKCLAQLFSQFFSKADFEWKRVFKL